MNIILSFSSIFACSWLCNRYGILSPYWFLVDANTFLAILNGLSGFMLFKNLKIPYNKIINTIAATTFGVLLIHANSDTMRQWLWNDLLDNVGAYYHAWGYIHVILAVVGIFAACIIIDMLRIRFIEKPFLSLWGEINVARYQKEIQQDII